MLIFSQSNLQSQTPEVILESTITLFIGGDFMNIMEKNLNKDTKETKETKHDIVFEGKRIKAAIFDMDGTMFDTERLRMDKIRQASQEIFGKPMSFDLLIDSFGLTFKAAEELAKGRYG